MSYEEEGDKGPILLTGKHPQRIYMLDNSLKTLLLDENTTAQEVCKTMAEKLNFENPKKDSRYFALFECLNGAHVNRSLTDAEKVLEVVQGWDKEKFPNALLVYQCKLFMPSLLNNTPAKVLQMLYIQAVHHVITGIYPCPADVAVHLAALQLQVRFGNHRPDSHKVGFLTEKLTEFIPTQLIGKKDLIEWEKQIFEEHKTLIGRYGDGDKSSSDPRGDYVVVVKEFSQYGNQFFIVEQEEWKNLPKVVALGVSNTGIYVFKPGDMEMYHLYKLSDIYRWGFQPNINFYFEIKSNTEGQKGPFYRVKTAEGQRMSDLLTDYAMAILREMGIRRDGDDDDEDEEGEDEDEEEEISEEESRARAATKIAAVYRGHKTRKEFDKMIEEMESELS